MIMSAESEPKKLPAHSLLYAAVRDGNLEQVQTLIRNNENPMAKDYNDDSSLHYAVESGQVDILKYLIEEVECPPGTRGWHGSTILHIAAQTKQFDVVQYLVESEKCRLDPSTEDEYGCSALYYACHSGDVEIVRYLIDCMMKEYMKKEDILYDQSTSFTKLDSHGMLDRDDLCGSLLRCACYYGHLSLVKFLIEECCCDPSRAQSKRQITALHSAVAGNHLHIVKYLAGVHQSLVAAKYDPVVHLAAQMSSMEMVEYVTQTLGCDFNCKYNSITPLHVACFNGRLDLVKFFLTVLNCDPTIKGEHGYQPIHYAACGGHVEVIKYLVEDLSIDPTSLSSHKRSPLDMASLYGRMAVVKYLTVQHSCNPSSMHNDEYGSSFHFAAAGGQIDVANYFVQECNCGSSVKTNSGVTVLHAAANLGRLEFLKFLVEELGWDPTVEDNQHRNALHAAVYGGQLSVTK